MFLNHMRLHLGDELFHRSRQNPKIRVVSALPAGPDDYGEEEFRTGSQAFLSSPPGRKEPEETYEEAVESIMP